MRDNLRAARKARGLTQRRMADEMSLDLWLDHILEIAYPGGYGAEEDTDAQ